MGWPGWVGGRRRLAPAVLSTIIAACGILGWVPGASAQAPSEAIALAVRQDLIRVAATGAVMGVVDRGGVRWLESFGMTDLEGSTSMHPRFKMHLGTFGDFLLAGLALEMDAQGRVDVDAPVREFLPALPSGLGERTLRALLTHTGGFDASPLLVRARGTAIRRQSVDGDRAMLSDQVIMLPADLVRSPSPHHTLLAGSVLEARGGGSIESAFRSYLLRPAGVAEVSFAPPGGTPPGVQPGFQVRLEPGVPYGLAPFPEPAVLQPQERIWAHALDFSRLLHHMVFTSTWRDALLVPRVHDPFDASGSGAFSLGFRWDSEGRGRMVGEGPGYTTEVRFLPLGPEGFDDGVVIFAMANGGASPLDRGLDAVEAWLLSERGVPDLRHADPAVLGEAPLSPVELGANLAGRYRNGSEMLHLAWDDGAMSVDLGLATTLPVRAGVSGDFEAYLPDGRVAFQFRVATAGSTAIVFSRGIAFVKDPPREAPRRD